MHPEVYTYVKDAVNRIETPISTVVEVGSYDVNGSVRRLFSGTQYVGIDVRPGRGVDVVANGAEWQPPEPVDVVVSTSTLEHTPQAMRIVANMAAMLKPGGTCIITCATDPFPIHSADGSTVLGDEFYRSVPPLELLEALRDAFGPHATIDLLPGGDLCATVRKPETAR